MSENGTSKGKKKTYLDPEAVQILRLYRLLQRYSDEEHPIPCRGELEEIISRYSSDETYAYMFGSSERKTKDNKRLKRSVKRLADAMNTDDYGRVRIEDEWEIVYSEYKELYGDGEEPDGIPFMSTYTRPSRITRKAEEPDSRQKRQEEEEPDSWQEWKEKEWEGRGWSYISRVYLYNFYLIHDYEPDWFTLVMVVPDSEKMEEILSVGRDRLDLPPEVFEDPIPGDAIEDMESVSLEEMFYKLPAQPLWDEYLSKVYYL